MTGTVYGFGEDGSVVVRMSTGDFSVIEVLGGHDMEINDELTGRLDRLGSCFIKNKTQLEDKISIVIERIYHP
ncbi:hypothetical protein FACS1894216_02200 [Synergistales bacterium]|nr:hypothetical protein FACS1894216_02200 [Synergistales bacterium]